MTDNNRIRSGSLQFYPRVRAKKVVPSVNWAPVSREGVGFMGFVGYKVGMISVWAKDDTEASLTKGKRIAIPATVIECPAMKIYSVRFYKGGKVMKDVVVSNDKDLKKKVKIKDYIKFFSFGGDGATYDIGLQSLSGALERGHDFLYADGWLCCGLSIQVL